MSLISEFKAFAIKGNVVDLAVAVIIGAAFGKIVDSLVKDVIMPVVGWIVGGLDFKNYYLNLGRVDYPTLEAAEKAGAPIIRYGSFINAVVDFFIIAFCIFIAVKLIHHFRDQQAQAAAAASPPPPAEDVALLREIRDELKKRPV